MARSDIPSGLRLCRASGWNQLEADWRCFLDFNPQGCRVVEQDGRVVGTVTTLRFEEKFSWISMLLVDPELRHRGIGSMLLGEALRLLKDMPTVRLDATPAGKLVYDKFEFLEEYRLVRMRALSPKSPGFSGVRPMTDFDLPGVLELDREVFGADRSIILRHLYGTAPEYAFVADSAGGLQGYVLGRHGWSADHIGPLVAPDERIARNLAAAPLSKVGGARPFLLDAPQHSEDWIVWLRSLGFVEERPFIRMFRGPNAFSGVPSNQFAITGPEFG
jgi:hypothetical protein